MQRPKQHRHTQFPRPRGMVPKPRHKEEFHLGSDVCVPDPSNPARLFVGQVTSLGPKSGQFWACDGERFVLLTLGQVERVTIVRVP